MMLMLTSLNLLTPKQVMQGTRRTFIPGDNTLWLAFDSTTNGLSHFYQFTDFLKRSWNIDDAGFMNIQNALSEAVINAIDHGNKWQEGKSVFVNARRDEDYYIFSIEDEGEGFNHNKIQNPTDKELREKEGGRGIFIMKYLSENVQFSGDGRCVKLLFKNDKVSGF
jgi:serine/threonine-protein kinase RsbW